MSKWCLIILLTYYIIVTLAHRPSSSSHAPLAEPCTPLHVRARGLDLVSCSTSLSPILATVIATVSTSLLQVCCNTRGGLSEDCQYKRYCSSRRCTCRLQLASNFSCNASSSTSSQLPMRWTNHRGFTSLPCATLVWPNAHAEYLLKLQQLPSAK